MVPDASERPVLLSDFPQIHKCFRSSGRIPEQSRRVKCCKNPPVSQLKPCSVFSCDPEIRPDQLHCCDPTKTDDELRIDECDLSVKPGATGGHLTGLGIAVMGRATFDSVGDVNLGSVQVNHLQHIIQKLSGWSYEGNTLQIFLFAGAFADKHEIGLFVPNTENKIPTFFAETAGVTFGTFTLQLFPAVQS